METLKKILSFIRLFLNFLARLGKKKDGSGSGNSSDTGQQ